MSIDLFGRSMLRGQFDKDIEELEARVYNNLFCV